MKIDTVPLFYGMSVGGCLFALPAEEFPTDEADVDMWRGFECDGAGGLEVEVEEGSVDGVEVRARCHDYYFVILLFIMMGEIYSCVCV